MNAPDRGLTKCPKCRTLTRRDLSECEHCGVVFAHAARGDKGPTYRPTHDSASNHSGCSWASCRFPATVFPGVTTGGGHGWCSLHYRCTHDRWGDEAVSLSERWARGERVPAFVSRADGKSRARVPLRMGDVSQAADDSGPADPERVKAILESLRELVSGRERVVRYRDVDEFRALRDGAPLREKAIRE